MDEVFACENQFIAQIVYFKTSSQNLGGKYIGGTGGLCAPRMLRNLSDFSSSIVSSFLRAGSPKMLGKAGTTQYVWHTSAELRRADR